MQSGSRRRRAGFTLIELTIVILIIGIMASLILVASTEGVRRAEERATQGLITKLETGMSDWYEALLNTQVGPNQTHLKLASPGFNPTKGIDIPGGQRAQVIARIDRIKAEMPDVFFVQIDPTKAPAADSYPLNFAAQPFPAGVASPTAANYVLPMGHAVPVALFGSWENMALLTSGAPNPRFDPNYNLSGLGIYGASYVAAAGVYKNLGYLPKGYNGVDDDGDTLVDEWNEGVDATNASTVLGNLQRHTHKTARSEMLYALLVEGRGPLGSVFNREDFTPRDIQDTDGDGLPEFVDAWGEPLQFYRWPTHFRGPIQKGALIRESLSDGLDNDNNGTVDDLSDASVYLSPSVPRDISPLDPNQQLIVPVWWSDLPADPRLPGAKAIFFQQNFFSLLDPLAASPAADFEPWIWDRGGYYKRRAFFSKFLIASSGPDRAMGIARFNEDYNTGGPRVTFPNTASTADQNARSLILIENQAAPFDPLRLAGNKGLFQTIQPTTSASAALQENGYDDITNQTIKAPGLGVR
jgi:prepilin-type N-terminal cleavage/methylation domain-containing protein